MLHSFTRNNSDLSTEAGFQFEFFCDCCGNGFKSTFKESSTYGKKQKGSKIGKGFGILGGIFGGELGDIGNAVERGEDIINEHRGSDSPQWRKEQEAAFDEAQEEVRPHFKKCPACSAWVCDDCWNEDEGLCITCAPRESAYAAKARNEAMRRNIDEEAETAKVWHGKLENRITVCPKCGKPAGDGKFCNNCGAPLSMIKCPNCGAAVAQGLKFCGECGSPISTVSICPECGTENPPGTKFCGECGTKL